RIGKRMGGGGVELARALTSMIAAAPSALHTTPTSRIACGDVLPAARATRNTDATVASAPAKAASGTSGDTGSAPATSAIAPATAAPAETPSRCGSASGFPRSAWSAAPEQASAPPTTAPSRTRGKRARKRMAKSGVWSPPGASAVHRLACTGPISAAPTTDATRSAPKPAAVTARRRRVRCEARTATVSGAEGLGMDRGAERGGGLGHARAGPEEGVGRKGDDPSVTHRRHARQVGEELVPAGPRPPRGVPDHVRRARHDQLERHLREGRAHVRRHVDPTRGPDQLVLQRSAAGDDQRAVADHEEHAARRQAVDAGPDPVESTAHVALHLGPAFGNAEGARHRPDRTPEVPE